MKDISIVHFRRECRDRFYLWVSRTRGEENNEENHHPCQHRFQRRSSLALWRSSRHSSSTSNLIKHLRRAFLHLDFFLGVVSWNERSHRRLHQFRSLRSSWSRREKPISSCSFLLGEADWPFADLCPVFHRVAGRPTGREEWGEWLDKWRKEKRT